MLKEKFTDTLTECRPWETGTQMNNTNIFNNLKENLLSYEKGYKKFSVKTKSELPHIKTQHCDTISKQQFSQVSNIKHKTLDKSKVRLQTKEDKYLKRKNVTNKSVELTSAKSQFKLAKSRDFHKRGMTSIQAVRNKQNKETIVSERRKRNNSKTQFKSKVFLISFDQQNKYRRLAKRQLHQIIFGQRNKQKYQKAQEIR